MCITVYIPMTCDLLRLYIYKLYNFEIKQLLSLHIIQKHICHPPWLYPYMHSMVTNGRLQGKMHSTTPKSPTEWWNLLHDLKSNGKWDDPDQYVKLDDLTNFFRSLYNDPTLATDAQTNPHLAFSCAEHFSTNPPTPELTQLPIEATLTSAEILSLLHKLKNGKATGLNLISNEILKCAGPTCLPFLTQLFNHIYNTSSFPTLWKEAYITTLHKKGPKHDLANYRPISITSCLGKLFMGTLNTRLMQFTQDANISHPFQGAFTKGRRGTDHIFAANTLIDQAKHLGHPLYAAFIDLQKAYDSVSHPLLFLGPKFCNLVEQTYANTSSQIKLGAHMGQPFSSNVGLRQGDPLSPLLFNLFIADLIFAYRSNCDPPTSTISQSRPSNLRTTSAISPQPRLAFANPSILLYNIAEQTASQ